MKKLDQIAALLKSQSTLALATVDNSDNARSTPLFYLVDDDLCLYWFSSATSGHSKDLKKHPEVSVSVHRPTAKWKEIKGVQMRGTASIVRDRVLRKSITTTYCKHFQLGSLFRVAISRSNLYMFRPSWIRYLDNTRHFGYKFEISLQPPTSTV